jgi:O-acetyl-ADP-ribose deacetylase (regulator of RNase III)
VEPAEVGSITAKEIYMKFVKGNILDAQRGIICHQCNCQLVMGAGLAKQIRDKYPRVYTEYKELLGKAKPSHRLGKCQVVEVVRQKLYVANIMAQFHYLPRGACHTDYDALSIALNGLKTWHTQWCPKDFPVFFPMGMGAGLAGGDWNHIKGLISSIIPDAVIVRYVK